MFANYGNFSTSLKGTLGTAGDSDCPLFTMPDSTIHSLEKGKREHVHTHTHKNTGLSSIWPSFLLCPCPQVPRVLNTKAKICVMLNVFSKSLSGRSNGVPIGCAEKQRDLVRFNPPRTLHPRVLPAQVEAILFRSRFLARQPALSNFLAFRTDLSTSTDQRGNLGGCCRPAKGCRELQGLLGRWSD